MATKFQGQLSGLAAKTAGENAGHQYVIIGDCTVFGGIVHHLLLPEVQPLTTSFEPAPLNGLEVITGQAFQVTSQHRH